MTKIIPTINLILTKQIIPTKIYKTNNTINIEHTTGLISIIYKTDLQRDIEFKLLDDKTFSKLTFNPYEINIIN